MEDFTGNGAMSHQGPGMGADEYALDPLSCHDRSGNIRASVRQVVEEQIKHEEATRELAPDAYRLSSLSDAAITGCYRKGKPNMGLGDLLEYFQETRQKRIRELDFSADVPVEAGSAKLQAAVEEPEEAVIPVEEKKHSGFIDLTRSWFDTSEEKQTEQAKRFTFSAFAVIGTLAVSLMLLVAGSVMNRRGEKLVSDMNREISAAYVELLDLEAKCETQEDLVLFRQIAKEEYGMVEEAHLRMQYITLAEEDQIEAYEEEREEGFRFSSLLSAIGLD